MTDTDDDERFMRVALNLAAKGEGSVEPNPLVGCVLVRDSQIITQGFHAQFGGPHAEIAALNSLGSDDDARGATAYVTLEPCCHHGKTPPCSQALVDAGIRRVVAAMKDPFGSVDGSGIAELRDAGVATTIGVLQREAELLNAPYLKRVQQNTPFVIAKWAMTIDGKIATVTGESQWITGTASRRQVHRLRGRVDAIIVGMGTVTADDPLLTARPPGPRTARRVVFCQSSLPGIESRLIQSIGDAPVTLVVARSIDDDRLQPLLDRGAELFRCRDDDPQTMVTQSLRFLAEQGATNVMLEGGGKLLASFLAAGQVDECHVYLGGKALGGETAPGPIGGKGIASLAAAISFQLQSIDRFDDDVRLVYRKIA